MKRLLATALVIAASACTGNSCVARGSKVLTPKGWKPIEDLEVGDIVYAFDEETGEKFETPVTAIRSAQREVGIVDLGETSLRMTTDHPTYCPRDEVYAPAGDWFLGQRTQLAVLGDSGFTNVEVVSTNSFVELSEVFDITVEHEKHNFVANGVLVHNKSPVTTCEVDGTTYEPGDECPCPGEATGTVMCADPPHCHCEAATNHEHMGDGGHDASQHDMAAHMPDATVDSGSD